MTNPQNKPVQFTDSDVLNMIPVLHHLIDEVRRLYNQYNNEPAANSIASQETTGFQEPSLVVDVYSRAMLSQEAAADHLMAYVESISAPATTLAPCTCARGLLESCAIAAWLLDPTIDAKTRVGRCFAFRYAGFIEQKKFYSVEKRQTEIDYVRQRIVKVEQDATAVGFSRILNNNGDINGIAQHMPSIIELIRETLDREAEYRLLSGVAHGHHWAIQQIGFREIERQSAGGQLIKALEKHSHPNVVVYVTLIAVLSYARVIWNLWTLFGWNVKEVETLLDTTCDQLHYRTELRFWH